MSLSKRQHFLCCFCLSENLLLKEKKAFANPLSFSCKFLTIITQITAMLITYSFPFPYFTSSEFLKFPLAIVIAILMYQSLKHQEAKLHGYKHINRNSVMPTFILLVWRTSVLRQSLRCTKLWTLGAHIYFSPCLKVEGISLLTYWTAILFPGFSVFTLSPEWVDFTHSFKKPTVYMENTHHFPIWKCPSTQAKKCTSWSLNRLNLFWQLL